LPVCDCSPDTPDRANSVVFVSVMGCNEISRTHTLPQSCVSKNVFKQYSGGGFCATFFEPALFTPVFSRTNASSAPA
jgi:hypothetical protein